MFAVVTIRKSWVSIESGIRDLEDDLKRIASRIRGWRHESGMTLQQLGDQSGVSASTIHKIENLQTVPTIAVLLKVAYGLGRRPSELLADAESESQVAVLAAPDRQRVEIAGRARLEHLAATIPRNRLDVWRVDLAPGAGGDTDGEAWRFQGEIVLLVEDGQVELELDGETYEAGPGDSIHFDTNASHLWRAMGGRKATCLVLALLPEHLQGDLMTRLTMSAGIEKPRVVSETVSLDANRATARPL